MRQCPVCLKWWESDRTQCPECCVPTMQNEASSEDADDGSYKFRMPEYLQTGRPAMPGFYGVNTVDPIPIILEWDGENWLIPGHKDHPSGYHEEDIVNWILLYPLEEK